MDYNGVRRLLVFLKYPTPGQVKTRLAASVGDEAASAVHRLCTDLILERLVAFRREMVLCIDPPSALAATRTWLGRDWRVRPQRGHTLGERLARATGEAFADGAKQVVVIGTDSPWLTATDIDEAFLALQESDVVIGPAQDGGYYLVGLAKPTPALFKDIPWSTAEACAQTLTKARELRLTAQLLRTGYDIDRLEDWERFVAEAAADDRAAARPPTINTRSHRRRGDD